MAGAVEGGPRKTASGRKSLLARAREGGHRDLAGSSAPAADSGLRALQKMGGPAILTGLRSPAILGAALPSRQFSLVRRAMSRPSSRGVYPAPSVPRRRERGA